MSRCHGPKMDKWKSDDPYTPGKPGRPRGSSTSWNRWSPEEWAVLEWAEKNGVKATEIMALGKLPGRTATMIQSHLFILRQKKLGRCACGHPLDRKGKQKCQSCARRYAKRTKDYLRQGLCAVCGKDRKGGTLTLCAKCMVKRRKDGRKKVSKENPPTPRKAVKDQVSVELMPWLGARGQVQIAQHPLWPGAQIVDLFGGSGRITMAAREAGHRVTAYNDVHPLLVEFMRMVRDEPLEGLYDSVVWLQRRIPDTATLTRMYREAKVSGGRDAAIVFHLMVRATKGRLGRGVVEALRLPTVPKRSRFHKRFEPLKAALQGVAITQMDFRDAIRTFDDPDTVFLGDPCWPGETVYEYGLDGRHRELIECLLVAKGHFVLLGQSSDAMARVMSGVPHLYWRYVGFTQELIASSFPLNKPLYRPFTLETLGLG